MGLEGTPKGLGQPDVAELRGSLRGPLLEPEEPGYEESRKLWNGMIDRRPALVVRPTGTADVVQCVKFARAHGLLLSVRGAGHNIAGTAVAEQGLALDMRQMKGVLVDPEERTVQAQPGCVLGDVDRETQLHGLATPLGFVSLTGVAGLTLGGGFGYLTRRFGWTVDNLLEIEIVTADAHVLRASKSENEDLFWAIRGGGGNFGVITSFKYRLHQIGPKIVGGIIGWPADRSAEVLKLYREVTAAAPRELTLFLTIRFAPSTSFVPPEWRGKPIIAIFVCDSSAGAADSYIGGLRKLGGSIFDTVVEKNYTEQQTIVDATQPNGKRYYWKSEYIRSLTDEFLSTFRNHAALETSPLSQMFLAHVQGAIGEKKADDGAVGNRDAKYVLVIVGGWEPDPDLDDVNIAWVRNAWQSLRPFSTGGVYINFQTADEGQDRVQASYGQNFERLAEIKAKYDPQNLFRVNRNVSPSRQS